MNTINKSLGASVAAAAIACAFQFAAPATRADDLSGVTTSGTHSNTEVLRQKVFVGDLDLSKPAGVKTLTARINGALRAVCGDSDIRDWARSQAVRQCRADSFANTMAQVHSATDSAVVASR